AATFGCPAHGEHDEPPDHDQSIGTGSSVGFDEGKLVGNLSRPDDGANLVPPPFTATGGVLPSRVRAEPDEVAPVLHG
ncbi:MAG: hypothetical protein JWN39_993, partial [Ilumatobacteraceae bacterium]|nr:hypothetical protein [Ilumatobacteraceae bacterium]